MSKRPGKKINKWGLQRTIRFQARMVPSSLQLKRSSFQMARPETQSRWPSRVCTSLVACTIAMKESWEDSNHKHAKLSFICVLLPNGQKKLQRLQKMHLCLEIWPIMSERWSQPNFQQKLKDTHPKHHQYKSDDIRWWALNKWRQTMLKALQRLWKK